MALDFHIPARELFDGALPHWWAHREPGSELGRILDALAGIADELATAAEGIHADQSIETARFEALREEWALLYGADQEQLPLGTEALRAYLLARAGEDGTLQALEDALYSLVATGPPRAKLRFPAGGGLRFPPIPGGRTAAGLRLAADVARGAYLTFALDGTGLGFPVDGSGLLIPRKGDIDVVDALGEYRIRVLVRDWLAFDRDAFARAVARHRPAHYLPAIITETP